MILRKVFQIINWPEKCTNLVVKVILFIPLILPISDTVSCFVPNPCKNIPFHNPSIYCLFLSFFFYSASIIDHVQIRVPGYTFNQFLSLGILLMYIFDEYHQSDFSINVTENQKIEKQLLLDCSRLSLKVQIL